MIIWRLNVGRIDKSPLSQTSWWLPGVINFTFGIR